MSKTPDQDKDPIAGHGVIVRAPNGDVIRHDPSGLTLRLSDQVIADIALRLDRQDGPLASPPDPAAPEPIDTDAHLAEVDAWNITHEGDWLRFTARLPGAQGVRGFRRHITGGAILGDGPGPLLGILGLGGPRAALASPGAPAFPHHVVAPADDIGAVGHAGIDRADVNDRLEPLRERPHEALVADTLLHWQLDKFAPLPLIFARVETDASTSAGALATGLALDNLVTAAKSLRASATRIGKPARILAICLDHALESMDTDAAAYHHGMLAVMARIEADLAATGFDKPLFVSRFEGGLSAETAAAALVGQWLVAWNHGAHRLIHSAPSYMFALDRFDRPTEEARTQMAEMTAAAISAGTDWRCPVLYLAEREGDAIRVIAQSDGPLILDDTLAPGDATAGFSLLGQSEKARITRMDIASDDPQSLLLHCEGLPDDGPLEVAYAAGRPGALRDGWSLPSTTGGTLHRWALPAILPVTGGARRD